MLTWMRRRLPGWVIGDGDAVAGTQQSHDTVTYAEAPFCAIDFELANDSKDSACGIGIVRVEHRSITARARRLIRPPSLNFSWSHLHGICAGDVVDERTFPAIWKELSPLFEDAAFLAAHNARFDREVLLATAAAYKMPRPMFRFVCTVELARHVWGLRPTRLPDVCAYLGIGLDHHDPLSDANACAQIALAAFDTMMTREG